ncbi:MAG: hypothetical protein IT168_22430 [Bryobacterales bacterium]|nr:hypothetical protein [Bryobacterales bacterium]
MGKLLGAFALGLVVAAGVVMLMRPAKETPPPVQPSEVTQSAVPSAPSEPEPEPAKAPEPERKWRRSTDPAPKASPVGAPVRKKSGSASTSTTAGNRQEAPPLSAPAPAPAAQNEPNSTPAPAPAPVPVAESPAPAPAPVRVEPPPKPPEPRSVTIPEGTVIAVQLSEKISTATHKDGDSFSATLAQPLVVEGLVLAERNSRVHGKVTQSVQSGRVKGVAQLGLQLTSITTSDKQNLTVHTAPFVKTAESSRGSDAAKIGAGAAIGAAIGAIAGGGRGAAIGAGAGGAAGAGTVMATRGKAAELPVETRLSFRLTSPVTVTEKLN